MVHEEDGAQYLCARRGNIVWLIYVYFKQMNFRHFSVTSLYPNFSNHIHVATVCNLVFSMIYNYDISLIYPQHVYTVDQ